LGCNFHIFFKSNPESKKIAYAHIQNQSIFPILRLSQRITTHTNSNTNEESNRIETRAKETLRYFKAVSIQRGIKKSVRPRIIPSLISVCVISQLPCRSMFIAKIGRYKRKQISKKSSLFHHCDKTSFFI
jgi:hypothetical protein